MEQPTINYGGQTFLAIADYGAGQNLANVITADVANGQVARAFDFTFRVFEHLLRHSPDAMYDLSRYYSPDHGLEEYGKSPLNRQFQLMSSLSSYTDSFRSWHMTMRALSMPSYPLLPVALDHYYASLNGKDGCDAYMGTYERPTPTIDWSTTPAFREAERAKVFSNFEPMFPLIKIP